MTCREKLAMEHPGDVSEEWTGGCYGCPHAYGYLDRPENCVGSILNGASSRRCRECWDREIPEETESNRADIELHDEWDDMPEFRDHLHECVVQATAPKILDSGDRTEFESGAVRDMRTGKGRCDLMPLDIVSEYFTVVTGAKKLPAVLTNIDKFQKTNDVNCLYRALEAFVDHSNWKSPYTMFLEVAKHFEEGCIKYGENNWRKGIPAKCYIDSAIRHYLKHMRGDRDEPHDRAFCWNILCCIWTIRHHPELNDYMKKEVESNG